MCDLYALLENVIDELTERKIECDNITTTAAKAEARMDVENSINNLVKDQLGISLLELGDKEEPDRKMILENAMQRDPRLKKFIEENC